MSVRLGSYNVLHSTSNRQTKRDFKRAKKSVDILGLQEIQSLKKRLIVRWIKRIGWDAYRPNVDHMGNVLAWDPTKYDLLCRGYLTTTPNKRDKGRLKKKHAVYGLFRKKSNGNKFWVINNHFQTPGYPWSQEVRRIQMQEIRELRDELALDGHPVFIVGDMNTTQPIEGGLGAPLVSAHNNHGIDHIIYHKDEAFLLKSARDRDKSWSSDHPFIYALFRNKKR